MVFIRENAVCSRENYLITFFRKAVDSTKDILKGLRGRAGQVKGVCGFVLGGQGCEFGPQQHFLQVGKRPGAATRGLTTPPFPHARPRLSRQCKPHNHLKDMSQTVSLNGAPTYPDIFYFHYITPIKLKKTFKVKLVQASYNHSNLRERTMSKPQMQKNTAG